MTPATVATRCLCPWDFLGKILKRLPFPSPGDLSDPGVELVSSAVSVLKPEKPKGLGSKYFRR